MSSSQTYPGYSPGLEGVIAGESAICEVDPNAGLLYRGYDVHELATRVPFEDAVWLLLHGELPAPLQSQQMRQDLTSERHIPAPVLSMLHLLPPDAHPIDELRTAVSMLAMFDPEENDHSHEANLRKAIRLMQLAER